MLRLRLTGLALALAGCTAVPAPPAATRADTECGGWFTALDSALAGAGLRDAEARPVPGFPYLRTSRLLRSFRDQLALPSMLESWLWRMRALDQAARRGEIGNLGTHRVAPLLGFAPDTPAPFLLQSLDECGRRLVTADLADPSRLGAVRAAVTPEPLHAAPRPTYRPVSDERGTAMAQALAEGLQTPPALEAEARTLYPEGVAARQAEAAMLLQSRRRDALGIPVLTASVERRLLETYAPVLTIEASATAATAASRVVLLGPQPRPVPGLDPDAPTVYTRVDAAREGGSIALQLVYSVWLNTVAGAAVEPLYLRLTLAPTGQVRRFEAMRGKGGDLLVVPVGGRGEPDARRAAFALPPPLQGQRLQVHIDAANASVTALEYSTGTTGTARYALVPDIVLRSLPVDGDPRRRASLYRDDGTVQGPHAAAAAVRQWGHQQVSDGAGLLRQARYFDSPIEPSFALENRR